MPAGEIGEIVLGRIARDGAEAGQAGGMVAGVVEVPLRQQTSTTSSCGLTSTILSVIECWGVPSNVVMCRTTFRQRSIQLVGVSPMWTV